MDGAGNLYGTTAVGGVGGSGTVFRISHAGAYAILHSFHARKGDGFNVDSGVVIDATGSLYGVTECGGPTDGSCGGGIIYKVKPSGQESTFFDFTSLSTVRNPRTLAIDSDGNCYGIAPSGCGGTCPLVFKVTAAGEAWVLHTFGPSGTYVNDNSYGEANLTVGPDGWLYGTLLYKHPSDQHSGILYAVQYKTASVTRRPSGK